MSGLVLKLREQPPQRCDLSQLISEASSTDAGALARLDIRTTRRPLSLGDIFAITPGDPSDIRIEGGSEWLDNIGEGMKEGRLRVIGDVGQRAGRGMSGGAILIEGSAGRLTGSAMSGGRIDIDGNAGDLVGAPLPGEMPGLKGGVIHIRGSAGARAGDRMRRGLITIDGDAGPHLGSRMGGGTIVCFGRAGDLPGYLMARGTLLLAKGGRLMSPTFIDTGVHELVALRLIARWLIAEGIEGGSIAAARLRRLMGDTGVLGKGEIFVPEIT